MLDNITFEWPTKQRQPRKHGATKEQDVNITQ
jgi:hypothetical protein